TDLLAGVLHLVLSHSLREALNLVGHFRLREARSSKFIDERAQRHQIHVGRAFYRAINFSGSFLRLVRPHVKQDLIGIVTNGLAHLAQQRDLRGRSSRGEDCQCRVDHAPALIPSVRGRKSLVSRQTLPSSKPALHLIGQAFYAVPRATIKQTLLGIDGVQLSRSTASSATKTVNRLTNR